MGGFDSFSLSIPETGSSPVRGGVPNLAVCQQGPDLRVACEVGERQKDAARGRSWRQPSPAQKNSLG